MIATHPLDPLPIWAVYLVTVGLLLLAIEGGYRLGKLIQKRWPDHAESGVGTMVGASLAFLGFLLAFITGMAMNLYNQRLHLVIEEANAIGTTYLRAGYLDEPLSAEARGLLREYVDQRLAMVEPGGLDAAAVRSDQIQADLWSQAEMLAKEDPNPVTALYIASLNQMIDLHAERMTIRFEFRVPQSVMLGLYLVGVLTMALIGMHSSYSGKRNYLALVLTVLILSMVYLIIVDLDRPSQGLIQVPQKALLDLQRQINSRP